MEKKTKTKTEQSTLPQDFWRQNQILKWSGLCFSTNKDKPVILLGSSYSAALALLIASETDTVKAVIAFNLGEYLKGVNVADEIKTLDRPVYATSANNEIEQTETILKNVKPTFVTQFKPEEKGFHGSKILWESVKGYEKHWEKLTEFIEDIEQVNIV